MGFWQGLHVAQFFDTKLKSALAWQGRVVARRPWPFLLLPLVCSLGLGYSLLRINTVKTGENALELYVPRHGLSKDGRHAVERLFGDTFRSEADPINGVTFMIIVRRRDGADILNEQFVSEYLWLRRQLEAIPLRHDGGSATYTDLCHRDASAIAAAAAATPTAAFFDVSAVPCAADFFDVVTRDRGIMGYRDVRLLQFPVAGLPADGGRPVKINVPLGDVNTTSLGYIRSAGAAMMTFTFSYAYIEQATQWAHAMGNFLDQWQSATILTRRFTIKQFQADLDSIAVLLQHLIPALLVVMMVFCVLACCVVDWVHSKPLLAVGGVASALMAIISGFGFTILCDVDTVDIVYVSPFLMLSVGVDDMFLMLAAWRKTSVKLPVEDRMANTFADAAVSITITSVTDALSFAIGCFSVFPAVRIFCTYTAVSLAFTYLYQITLFGAVMAYSGYREQANRHCILFVKLKTSADADQDDRSLCYRILCTGGDGGAHEDCAASSVLDGTIGTAAKPPLGTFKRRACMPISPNDNVFNIFFQRYYAPLLRFKSVQIAAGVSYIFYLAMAIYGATTVQIGMNYVNLLPESSLSATYLHDFGEYFVRTMSAPLEVILPELDAAVPSQQEYLIRVISQFENGPYTREADFWLLDFLPFYNSHVRGMDFYVALDQFLKTPHFARYSSHIRFNPLSRRLQSRALVGTHDIAYGAERNFLAFVKQVLSGSALMRNVSAFHPTFAIGEQQANVLPVMLQTVCTATAAMLFVSFMLIPKAACSLCLAASIVSTNLGVLGAMSLWDVRLDIISMITVLMSIGISVDFVAHVSYHYVQAVQMDRGSSQAQRALRYLGLPILQGAISTVCGMLVLLAVPAYMVRAFVKTLLLVIAFGLYHGLLLLPIVLSLFIRDRGDRNKGQMVHGGPSPTTNTTNDSGSAQKMAEPGINNGDNSSAQDSGLPRSASETGAVGTNTPANDSDITMAQISLCERKQHTPPLQLITKATQLPNGTCSPPAVNGQAPTMNGGTGADERAKLRARTARSNWSLRQKALRDMCAPDVPISAANETLGKARANLRSLKANTLPAVTTIKSPQRGVVSASDRETPPTNIKMTSSSGVSPDLTATLHPPTSNNKSGHKQFGNGPITTAPPVSEVTRCQSQTL